MSRALAPALMAAVLTLSACSTTVGPGSAVVPDPVSAGSAQQSQDPVPSTEEEPADQQDEPAATPDEPSAPAEPAVRWYPRGIGLPLTTDAPAAKEKKVVMLTFDDGPSETDSTARILDVLKEQQVKAVFFVTGYGARHEGMLRRIHDEGHVVGLHTMTHPDLTTLRPAEMLDEIEPLIETVGRVTGRRPKYFRPPFGSYDEHVRAVLDELDLELINWTSGSLDWEGNDRHGYKDPALVVSDVMDQLFRGAVYLFHDTKAHTAEALPEIIRRIRAEGYEFVTLS